MRYLHQSVEPIAEFLESRGLRLFLLDFKGEEPSKPVDATALKPYLEESNLLWGDNPNTYLVAAHGAQPPTMMVHEAVEQAETESPIILALVAYADGGIISVSNQQFDFQRETQSGEWWKPTNLSQPALSSLWLRKLLAMFKRE
ncbi:hypothetical protein [Microvirga splendida]|uniref:Uncharacterized protein n=1 Tax=Microvirga splendida TaxID=2795727 RepID=A0ABS0Y1Q8_9HYPH|nr:hypothetical protein [Microvirga splendida]MBJ6126251.1 hypothetical protein [Microvirga splendida]